MKLINILFYAPLSDVIPIFPNSGLNAACWAYCMCHLLFSQDHLRSRWKKTLPENYFPHLKTFSSKFCYSMLLSLYFVLSNHIHLLSSGWVVIQWRAVVVLTFCCVGFLSVFLSYLWPVHCVLSLWGKILIKGSRLRRPLMVMDVKVDTVGERLIDLITHSLAIYSPWLLPQLPITCQHQEPGFQQ